MFNFIWGRITRNISALAALGVLFFALAGTINVWGFWLYVATVLGYQLVSLLIIMPRHPEYGVSPADISNRSAHAPPRLLGGRFGPPYAA